MRKRTMKKRCQGSTMINFQDFIHIRSQKEKIINNPFQQNWKKSIIMDQLLALYKPHVAGLPPSTPSCTKSDYIQQYPLNPSSNDDTFWNTNQQGQINKYFKMVEGMNRWQDTFDNSHIQKIAAKIVKRVAHRKPKAVSEIQIQNETMDLKKERRLHQHSRNQSLPGFTSLMRKPQSHFKAKKQEVERLQSVAVRQYGLKFKENSQKNYIQFNFDQFKKKDKEIFDKFMNTLEKSPINVQAKPSIISSNIPSEIQLKRAYPLSPRNSPAKQIYIPKSAHSPRKKKYLRIECD